MASETPQPAPDPDAATTVNDFLDYTDYFPSDLLRSLRLIGDLDGTYLDTTQIVHELTHKYAVLPSIPNGDRPDPTVLRRDIAAAIDKAISCRESTFAEASRLYEVAERHCHRLAIIKRKLQALPQPPSRDPTPAPVSPQVSRPVHRSYDRAPHLRITFDSRHGAGSTRARDRGRKSVASLARGRSRAYSSSSDGSDAESDLRSTIDLAITPKRVKHHKDKTPRPPKPARTGTNVHSSIAGISTSNALARLSPPPPDAKPGSKYAPWFKLTEYEMAVLRKQMKKNAVWTPSETMIRRELQRKGRGHEFYDSERARCEATGEEFLDEEPVTSSSPQKTALPPHATTPAPAVAAPATPVAASASTPAPAPVPAPTSTPASAPPSVTAETAPASVEPLRDTLKEETTTVNKGMKLNEAKEAKKVKRESQRQQAMRDAQEVEHATRKIKEAADGLKELNFGAQETSSPDLLTTQRRKSSIRSISKRKRSPSPGEAPTAGTRETSLASQDSGTKPPDAKRMRLATLQPTPPPAALPSLAPAPAPESGSQPQTPVVPSPAANTPVPLPDSTTITQVPLAPAGPSTPTLSIRPSPKAPGRQPTPGIPSPAEDPDELSAPAPQPTVTAASSRPRRESVIPKAATPPPMVPAQLVKRQKTPTPTPELVPTREVPATRPRSARGHVPTPKAQSEEPKLDAVPAPTRKSTRRKPPPEGDITAAEDGQKTVTNVKRAQGSKSRRKKKSDEDHDPAEDVDPNEPRYCICDDISYGQMISCDNNCEKEWFHLSCVAMAEKDIPSRRAKWYCPDCRQQLGSDAYGNPLVPPALPGRRGNR